MENTVEFESELIQLRRENVALKDRVEELADFFENASIPLHWVDGDA